MNPFKSVSYSSGQPGSRLIALGAVHGNEVCGSLAIGQVMAMFDAGEVTLDAGHVTFVPVTNPLAYAKRTRAGDRNLNRGLQPTDAPAEFEDEVANSLCPLLARTAIVNALTHLGLLSGARPEPVQRVQTLRLCEVVDRVDASDEFARAWQSFDAIQRGDLIATRGDGARVVAPFDGFIVFPSPTAAVATEWFYLAKQSDRLARVIPSRPASKS